MKKKFLTEKRIELLIRFWGAGAVYFFVGWGTGLGLGSPLDFILLLGLAMAILEMFAVNPIIKRALNVKSTGGYLDTSVFSKVRFRLLYVLKTIGLMAVVAVIYNLVNQGAVLLFSLPKETLVLPGEPILFGVFYTAVFKVFEDLKENISYKMKEMMK